MTGKGHHAAALGGSIGLYFWTTEFAVWLEAVLIATGCLMGGKAPDWLELPLWNGQARIIPHRRITHWICGWFVILGGSYLLPAPVSFAVAGFSIGCLIHLSGDMLTPQGVPILHPWKRTGGANPASPALAELGWIVLVWMIAIPPYLLLA